MKYEEILVKGGPTPDREQLVACMQPGNNCHYLPELNDVTGKPSPVFTMGKYSTHGYCWRVNPGGMIKGKRGDYGRLHFWTDVQDYGEKTMYSPTLGFTVAFHDNTTYSMSSGFLMTPGTYNKADLRLREEARIPEAQGGKCDPEKGNGT